MADTDPSSPQYTQVSALGTLVELSPTLLDFLSVPLRSVSTLPVTLTNVGKKAVGITGVTAVGDYSSSNNCGSSVPPQGTCTINVTFTPTGAGKRNGALSIATSDPASPERVSLTGVGQGIVFSPKSLVFTPQKVGTTSPPQTVTITNQNTGGILLGAITANDDFIVSANSCPATLAPLASCTFQVEFSPDELGGASGIVYVSDDDINSPQGLGLTGTGK